MTKIPPLQDELRPLLFPYDILKPAEVSSKQNKSVTTVLLAILLLLSFSVFYCIFTIRLWPYAFPAITTPQPTFTSTQTPLPTITDTPAPTSTETPIPTITPTLRPDQGAAIGNVNIRSGPGIQNKVLDILYEGELFIVLKEGDGWLYIRRDVEGKSAVEGWVNQLWVTR